MVGFAFEELACRGEDVKLIGEYGLGWRAFVYLDDQQVDQAIWAGLSIGGMISMRAALIAPERVAALARH